jgi:hypothetical protein
MTMYNDIYARDGLTDSGNIPYTGATACYSPDIIPQQQTQQPLAWFTSNWGSDPGLNINAGTNNYIYVRGKNLKSTATSGNVFLYCTPSSLLLDVSYWSNNPVQTGAGSSAPLVDVNNNAQIAVGAICVGNTPFLLNQNVPQGFHYCLVTRVVTPDHPNPIPVRFSSTGQFVNWVVNNPNVAWRNVNVVASTTGAVSQSQYYENLDAAGYTYWFVAQGTNFPNSSVVVIESVTAGNTFKASGLFGAPPGPQTYMTQQTVPAGFKGVVNVTVTPPAGQTIPSGATLSIQYFRQTQMGDEDLLRQHEVRADTVGFHPRALADALEGAAVPAVVQLGECNIQVK